VESPFGSAIFLMGERLRISPGVIPILPDTATDEKAERFTAQIGLAHTQSNPMLASEFPNLRKSDSTSPRFGGTEGVLA
jgi:hypothetical protein